MEMPAESILKAYESGVLCVGKSRHPVIPSQESSKAAAARSTYQPMQVHAATTAWMSDSGEVQCYQCFPTVQ